MQELPEKTNSLLNLQAIHLKFNIMRWWYLHSNSLSCQTCSMAMHHNLRNISIFFCKRQHKCKSAVSGQTYSETFKFPYIFHTKQEFFKNSFIFIVLPHCSNSRIGIYITPLGSLIRANQSFPFMLCV
jgi:hypothetical protein